MMMKTYVFCCSVKVCLTTMLRAGVEIGHDALRDKRSIT